MEFEMDEVSTLDQLPYDCISVILSFTSPPDACRSSLVSSNFQSAADSNWLWLSFLPSNIDQILSSAVPPPPVLEFLSKKALFLHLSDYPLLIDNRSKCFWLDKCSGKKCYMVAAGALTIERGDTPQCWRWRAYPESRFPQVAELLSVNLLQIRGRMEARLLSPDTRYGAYLVFKLTDESHGLESPADVSVNLAGENNEDRRRTVYLNPAQANPEHPPLQPEQIPHEREYGWLEIEMGDFFNESGEDRQVEMTLMEGNRLNWKSGLIIQGIELRPKNIH